MPASQKIAAIRLKMVDLDPESPIYKAYEDIIVGLGESIEKPKVVVHKSVEPEICESCQ